MYCDMSEYINGRIEKKELLNSLSATGSPFAELYKKSFPTIENAGSLWEEFEHDFLRSFISDETIYPLSFTESKAIVYWIYRTYPNVEKRKEQTKIILRQISKLFELEELAFSDCIIYVKSRVEINIVSSFDRFYKDLQKINSVKQTFYYRGHSDINYLLIPSVMRRNEWSDHECDMYNELIIECPEEFIHCSSHLDKLVHMQHYGLPTRLLDITRNPLVALYFACISNPAKNGEVIVFTVGHDKVKYPGSDTATVLASIPLFNKHAKEEFANWASDPKLDQETFNKNIIRLLHEIKLEKPAFRDEVKKKDVLDCFFVLSEKRNSRIIKQDGAFIICGLFDKKNNPINKYRYMEKRKIQIFLIPANRKKSILQILNKFSINRASLFPEISDVTSFIMDKY